MEETIKTDSEAALKTFSFAYHPEVTQVRKLKETWSIRIMWGFENEGIEVQVEEPSVESIRAKIAKDLNGIKHYSRVLYDKIMA